jgi:hypothetical protein
MTATSGTTVIMWWEGRTDFLYGLHCAVATQAVAVERKVFRRP